MKLTGKRLEDLDVLIVGLGAAGIAVAKILLAAGVRHVIGCDSKGALSTDRADYQDGSMSAIKRWFAEATNEERRSGGPADVIEGADLFVGLSGARVMPAAALAKMADDAMVFAMANPTPEVTPEEAEPYARIIATGRSDYPNQINNVLCFPGIFRGALDVRARDITEDMKMAAARGIAAVVGDADLREDHIIPSPFNRDVPAAVAAAVVEQAKRDGYASPTPARSATRRVTHRSSGPSAEATDVTGATGRLGSLIVAALTARGDEVTVLSRSPDKARARLGVDAVAWDPLAGPAPADALAGRDAVVHLAGEDIAQRWNDESLRRIRESRELGTRNLVAGLERPTRARPR